MRQPLIVLLTLSLTLSACGTFRTVGKTNDALARDLQAAGSLCEQMPRAYSGMGYNLCRMHANTGSLSGNNILLGFYALDTVFSCASDTVLLPLTLTQQYQFGSVTVAGR